MLLGGIFMIFTILLTALILFMICFLSMVCIQFNYISNLNLTYGMDLSELCSDDYDRSFTGVFEHSSKSFALALYKLSKIFKQA